MVLTEELPAFLSENRVLLLLLRFMNVCLVNFLITREVIEVFL